MPHCVAGFGLTTRIPLPVNGAVPNKETVPASVNRQSCMDWPGFAAISAALGGLKGPHATIVEPTTRAVTNSLAQFRKLRYVGLKRNLLWAEFTAPAYNLIRIANLRPEYA